RSTGTPDRRDPRRQANRAARFRGTGNQCELGSFRFAKARRRRMIGKDASHHGGALVERSRPRVRELGSEAIAGLVQRPARTLLTMLGTVLGVGAFVAVLGLTSTAGGQISSAFSIQSATQIDVDDSPD